jgi:trehalose-6-phosphate synthase
LGYETRPQGVIVQDRQVAVGVFPIGIEPHKFEERLETVQVQDRIKELEATFAGKRVFPPSLSFPPPLSTLSPFFFPPLCFLTNYLLQLIIGIDRLDYIKGIPHRLLGFEAFLRDNPEARGKVVLLQVLSMKKKKKNKNKYN